MKTPATLNGVAVTRRAGTVFVPLPKAAWVEIGWGCQCAHCSGTGDISYWDTLAIAEGKDGERGVDTTWMVHYPELHR